MRRRALLANVGGLLAAGAAGCLASGNGSPGGTPDGDNTTTDDPTTDDPTTTPGDPTTTGDPGGATNWDPASSDPFETVTVGTREGVAFPDNNEPHAVRVWNDASESRSIALALTAGDETTFDRKFEFPADGWIGMTLNEPAAYELAVAVEGERVGAVTLERDLFDCNDSMTRVAVNAEAAVDSITETTDMACPGPEIAGQSLTVGEGGCGTRDDATATFEDGAVGVEGAIRTPDPCHELALSAARLLRAEEYEDGSDDVLELVVTAEEKKGGTCTQCVGSIAYEATVEFDNEYPSNVRVVHESMDDRRVVLETGR